MHGWPLFHRDNSFWCWWAVSQCTVRSFGVVVLPPSLDYDLRLPERIEDFAVEQFVPHPGVEALDVAVLPRTARQANAGIRREG